MEDHKSLKILVVDDLPENLVSLKAILAKERYLVETASSGNRALQLLLKDNFGLVLLDVQMPDMDGFEVAEHMRSNSRTKHIPIIFLSALATQKDFFIRGLQLGAIDYITKPVDTDLLLIKVSNLLILSFNDYKLKKSKKKVDDLNKSLELQYKSILENMNDAFVIDNIEGKVIFANKRFFEIFKMDSDDVNDFLMRDYIVPEYYEMVSDFHKLRINGEDVPDLYECKGILKDETELWLEIRVSTIQENGEIIGTQSIIRDITERKQAQDRILTLLANAENFNRAVNKASIVSQTDTDGNIIHVNNRFCEVSGYSTKELLGRNMRILNSGYHSDVFFKKMWKKIAAGKTWHGEFRNKSKNGDIYWVDSVITPVINKEGIKSGYLAIESLITERKSAEQILKEREERFSALIKGTSNIIWVLDSKGEPLANMDSWTSFTGQTNEDIRGGGWINAIHPEEIKKVQELLGIARAERKVVTVEVRINRFDGEWIWMNVNAVPIFNSDGSLREWIGSVQDINERKKAEKLLKESEQRLLEAQHLAKMGSWEYDIENNIIKWSPEIFRIFELKPNDFEATYQAFLNLIHPDDRIKFDTLYLNSINNAKPYLSIHRLLCHDGRIKYVENRGKTTYDKNGIAIKSQGTVQDITERKLAEIEISNQNNKLKRQNEEMEQYTYIASHDLQEPLITLSSIVEILETEYANQLEDDIKPYLEYISKSSRRMQELVKGLMDYSRIGKQDKQILIDLNEIIAAVLEDLQETINSNNVIINVPDLPKIIGYPTEIRLLFQNLISNAVKFRKEGKTPEITVSWKEDVENYFFSIRDNGIGIRKKDYDKIFVMFRRLHNHDDYDGTGIGLTHCKKIIELHNGSISVESEFGNGSVFNFRIPKL